MEGTEDTLYFVETFFGCSKKSKALNLLIENSFEQYGLA